MIEVEGAPPSFYVARSTLYPNKGKDITKKKALTTFPDEHKFEMQQPEESTRCPPLIHLDKKLD